MKFKQIQPQDYSALKRFFENQPHPLSAYTLGSIIAWNNEFYQPYYLIEDDTLLMSAEFTKRPQNRHLIMPMTPGREHTPQDLERLARRLGFERFRFIPEDYLKGRGEKEVGTFFEIREQPEYEDYVYRREDLATLKGNKYAKKRNLIHQFERDYAGRFEVEAIIPAVVPECITFLEEWCRERNCDKTENEDLFCERVAATNCLKNLERFEMKGLIIRVDHIVSALGLGTRLTDDIGVLHFEKAFSRFKGLYQYLDRVCAKTLFKGFEYINKESDMNIYGLARAKKSYHPVRMVKSYELMLK